MADWQIDERGAVEVRFRFGSALICPPDHEGDVEFELDRTQDDPVHLFIPLEILQAYVRFHEDAKALAWEAENDEKNKAATAALSEASGRAWECPAFLRHGPGHQSKTTCHPKGEHEVHEAEHSAGGGPGVLATWRGPEATTGYHDEPPPPTRTTTIGGATVIDDLMEAPRASLGGTNILKGGSK